MFNYKEWYQKRGGRHDYYLAHRDVYLNRTRQWKLDNPKLVKLQKKRYRDKYKYISNTEKEKGTKKKDS